MLCECGCGQQTKLAPRTHAYKGWVKGRPMRYVKGHHRRKFAGDLQYEIQDRGYETPCWIWQWTLADSGYGLVWSDVTKRMERAHRIFYERVKGPIPDGLQLDHLCRERRCVNPDHLEPVTHAENCRRGERTVLTHDQVAEIRKVDREVAPPAVGALYGVSEHTIRAIWQGRSWR